VGCWFVRPSKAILSAIFLFSIFFFIVSYLEFPNSTQILGLKFKINVQSKLQYECDNILIIYLFISLFRQMLSNIKLIHTKIENMHFKNIFSSL
jgi:hypothetical protein